MAEPGVFFAVYPGEMTPEDRAALDRPCFELYENGIGMSKPFWQAPGAARELETYQLVRVSATSPGDARRRVVDALGRKPDGLRVEPSDAYRPQ